MSDDNKFDRYMIALFIAVFGVMIILLLGFITFGLWTRLGFKGLLLIVLFIYVIRRLANSEFVKKL